MTLDGENVTTFSLKQELSFVAKKLVFRLREILTAQIKRFFKISQDTFACIPAEATSSVNLQLYCFLKLGNAKAIFR